MTKDEPREAAFKALYTADLLGVEPDAAGLGSKARRLVDGVWQHRGEIDAVVGRLSQGWRVERMPTIDRNVIRLGTFELLYSDAPVGVAVSEAVELAKRYSTAKSGAFVNGILGRLAEELKAGGRDGG